MLFYSHRMLLLKIFHLSFGFQVFRSIILLAVSLVVDAVSPTLDLARISIIASRKGLKTFDGCNLNMLLSNLSNLEGCAEILAGDIFQ